MPTLAFTTGLDVVSKPTYTADGSVFPEAVITCDEANGWSNLMSKYTV